MANRFTILTNNIRYYFNINRILSLLILTGDRTLNTVEDYRQQELKMKNKDYKFYKEKIENYVRNIIKRNEIFYCKLLIMY